MANKSKFWQRERRKAKQSNWKRLPKKPGIAGHGSSLTKTTINTSKDKTKGVKRYYTVKTGKNKILLIFK